MPDSEERASGLPKAEFEEYRGGQRAAWGLTAVLWLIVAGLLVALRQSLEVGGLSLVVVAAVSFVGIGWCQASLNNGFHEAVHENFGNPHHDWLALFLLGFPTFFTLQYREVHLRHHLKIGDPKLDPDYATYGSFPHSRWQFLGRLLVMGSGLAAARQLWTRNLRSSRAVTHEELAGKQRAPLGQLVGLAVTQALLLGGFLLLFPGVQGVAFYLAFWILPLGMVAKLAKSTRAFCEHGSPDRSHVLRTITGRPWQTATLGMYGFHYHGEHHLYPWVAYSRLPALHGRLRSGLVAKPDTRDGLYEHFEGGYLGLLVHWFRALPWRASR